jgi:hypothetical protein
MKSVPHMIKEALDNENEYNPMANFFSEYYMEILRLANINKPQVITNKDEGFIKLHERYGDSLDKN